MSDEAILEALERVEALLAINGRPRVLLGRGEAAEAMGISLRHFQQSVAPHVPFVQIGKRVMYRPRDLDQWAADRVDDASTMRRSRG